MLHSFCYVLACCTFALIVVILVFLGKIEAFAAIGQSTQERLTMNRPCMCAVVSLQVVEENKLVVWGSQSTHNALRI